MVGGDAVDWWRLGMLDERRGREESLQAWLGDSGSRNGIFLGRRLSIVIVIVEV